MWSNIIIAFDVLTSRYLYVFRGDVGQLLVPRNDGVLVILSIVNLNAHLKGRSRRESRCCSARWLLSSAIQARRRNSYVFATATATQRCQKLTLNLAIPRQIPCCMRQAWLWRY
jgi:hypothetical protein